jgi:ADP-L-glycero-D-manno-heptose 6-epimerase
MIVVTGSAGFIGSNLVAGLNAVGHDQLVLVDWLGTRAKWRNLLGCRYLDIVLPEDLAAFLADNGTAISTVFHLGANSSTTTRDGDAILRTNVHPSMMLWRWCAKHGKTLIYASSAATYGDGSHGFEDDRDLAYMERLQPLNLYAWSKHTFDIWALQRALEGHAPPRWAGLKFFNVYGPNEFHKGEMMSIVAKNYLPLKRSETVRLFKSHRRDYQDGGQIRDFVYVRDCVDIMLWMMRAPMLAGIFNVGTGEARSFKDLIQATAQAMGAGVRIEYIDMPLEIRTKYQYFTQASMTKLRSAGYDRPFTPIEDGTREYVRTYLQHFEEVM